MITTDKVERFLKTLRHFYPEHNRRFESGRPGYLVGEYYGRGGLEGLSVGLSIAQEFMSPEEQEALKDKLTLAEKAYLEVWGGDRVAEMDNPKQEDEDE